MRYSADLYARALIATAKENSTQTVDDLLRNLERELSGTSISLRFVIKRAVEILERSAYSHRVRVQLSPRQHTQEQDMVDSLRSSLGDSIDVRMQYDAAILGGARITIDEEYAIDATVNTTITKIYHHLIS